MHITQQAESPWLYNRLDILEQHPGLIVLLDEGGWGTPYLLAGLKENKTHVIWLELTAQDEHVPVAQGNKLASAVNKTLGDALMTRDRSYDDALAVLKSHHKVLQPLVFAMSGAEFGVDLAQKLLELPFLVVIEKA